MPGTAKPAKDAQACPSLLGLHPLYAGVVLIALFFVLVIYTPPIFCSSVACWFRSWQKAVMGLVCHQQLARTFQWDGIPLAACSRCTGIYSGFLLALVSFVKKKETAYAGKHYIMKIFVFSTVVLVVDGVGNLTGLWFTSDTTRAIIGGFWGVMTGILMLMALTITRIKKGDRNNGTY